jgi:hypothetical protein
VLVELRLEALEQREGVRGAARETGEDAILVQAADFLRAALMTTLPSVTCPSPPSATCPLRRTERMVVPWNGSMDESLRAKL